MQMILFKSQPVELQNYIFGRFEFSFLNRGEYWYNGFKITEKQYEDLFQHHLLTIKNQLSCTKS